MTKQSPKWKKLGFASKYSYDYFLENSPEINAKKILKKTNLTKSKMRKLL